jgi:ComF family protein
MKNLVVPVFCHGCSARLLTEENGFFCPTCWEHSPRIERPFCTQCGHPHPGAVGFGTRSNFPCADCRDHPPKHLRRMWGAARYDGPVAEAIRLFKFNGRRRLAEPLAIMMAEFAERELDQEPFDILVPVPLHRVRLRARGFNQSALLAERLAEAMGLPVSEALVRVRPTRVQSLLDDTERPANIVGAFGVREEHPFRDARVLLIDDVVTTGSTVTECAAALRRAGAREVSVFAAAMAV